MKARASLWWDLMKAPEVEINPLDGRPSLIWPLSDSDVEIRLKSKKELRLLWARIAQALEYADAPEA